MRFKFIQMFAEAVATTAPAAGVSTDGAASIAGMQDGNVTAEGTNTATGTEEAKSEARKTLRELIDSDEEYKAEYKTMTSAFMRKRLGETKPLETKAKAYDEIVPTLAQFYGLKADDLDGISKAVKGDDTFFKKAAVANNTSPTFERNQFTLTEENRRMKDQIAAISKKNEREETLRRWNEEIPKIKEIYPSFDLDAEMSNPYFARLAHTVDLRTAYENIHRDEINAAMMQYASRLAAEQMAQNVAANQARPTEGGLSTNAAPNVEVRPRDFTKEERQNIRNRVRRGEKVRF